MIREGVRRHEVALAQLHRIDAHLSCRHLDETFDDKGGLRPSRTTVGIDHCGVVEHRLYVAIDQRRGVLAGEQGRVEIAWNSGRMVGQIGAHIGDGIDLHGEELAVLVQRQLRRRDVVAAMGVGHEALAPLRRPLDRAADFAGGPDAGGVLGIGIDLRPEAAAHVRSNHAQLGLRYAEHIGAEIQAQEVRVLVG